MVKKREVEKEIATWENDIYALEFSKKILDCYIANCNKKIKELKASLKPVVKKAKAKKVVAKKTPAKKKAVVKKTTKK